MEDRRLEDAPGVPDVGVVDGAAHDVGGPREEQVEAEVQQAPRDDVVWFLLCADVEVACHNVHLVLVEQSYYRILDFRSFCGL